MFNTSYPVGSKKAAKVFLLKELAAGPKPAADVYNKGVEQVQCSQRTLEQAKRELGIKSSRVGAGKGAWWLTMPKVVSAEIPESLAMGGTKNVEVSQWAYDFCKHYARENDLSIPEAFEVAVHELAKISKKQKEKAVKAKLQDPEQIKGARISNTEQEYSFL